MLTDEFKSRLEKDLLTTIKELQTIAIQNKETGDWVAIPEKDSIGNADANIVADAVEEWNERRSLMSSLETRYSNIMRALAKISNDTYGICEISQEEIEPARLEANPAARTNIANRDNEENLPV